MEVVPQIDSTNSALMARARSGHTQPTLLVAEHQQAGRGRMGRQWHSGAVGDALTFSLGMRLPAHCDVRGLSLAVGCSICNSLDAHNQHGLRLKWPNDVWLAQRKLGGILVEVSVCGTQRYVVVGVGLNLARPPHCLAHTQAYSSDSTICYADNGIYPTPHLPQPSPPAPQPVAWLRECMPAATAPDVLGQVAVPLAHMLHQFCTSGFAPWQPRFAARDALLHQRVWLSDGSQGTALGVGVDGALRIQMADGSAVREVVSDEISVRPL